MFGIIDPFTAEFGDDRPTWPPPGTGKLIVEDVCELLFYSAIWTLVASVGNDIIARSAPSDCSHPIPYTRRWSRQAIRTNYVRLRQLGVDAEGEYASLGGSLSDLKR